MEHLTYKQLKESVYTETLENGLQVSIVPKKGFNKTYALFTTKYGSIDNEFVPLGMQKFVKVPDGIAHFLEHKMFEKEDGDVFQKFGSLGASANAFTSFTKTSYLFSASENIYKNLEILLEFVQNPYFTDETVEKEKGIIAQEIQMYQDNPDWRLHFELLKNLFPKHPMHIDIAGTVDSIKQITAEDLYMCYDTFYHPSNMKLLIVGNIDPEIAMSFVRDNQRRKDYIKIPEIKRRFPIEMKKDIKAHSSLELNVVKPKIIVGGRYMDDLPKNAKERRKFQYAVMFGLSLLFGNTSRNYNYWYQSGLIDDSFGFDFNQERDVCFFSIGADTVQPERLIQQIEVALFEMSSVDFTEEKLTTLKRKQIGRLISKLNSVEFIAQHFDEDNDGVTVFDLPDIIDSVTIGDVKKAMNKIIDLQTMSTVTIYPKK